MPAKEIAKDNTVAWESQYSNNTATNQKRGNANENG